MAPLCQYYTSVISFFELRRQLARPSGFMDAMTAASTRRSCAISAAQPAGVMYVNERINRHLAGKSADGVLVFCLESVNRSDPILRKIKVWIVTMQSACLASKQRSVVRLGVCGRCGASDNLKTGPCGLMRCCGRECQVADWKEHKKRVNLAGHQVFLQPVMMSCTCYRRASTGVRQES